MEITKREILASVTIVAVMMILGFVIAGRIDAYQIQKNSEYYSALQITDTEQFQYGMETSVGNAFVYGTLEAVDPVTYPEIGGEYLYAEKDEEHYNRHTRTVTTTDSEGHKHTRTEVYWTWDHVGSESIHSNRISFLGIEIKYYGTPVESVGTIYTDLRDGAISDESKFFDGSDIENTIKRMTISWTWIFWIGWIILTGATTCGFCYLENDWLNK